MKVARILHDLNYSLQSNRKTEEGADHPDRDAQFPHINAAVKKCLAQGSPVISVDTKTKELIGNHDNAGRQWLAGKRPTKVQGHDFPGPEVPRAFPYGIYDLAWISTHHQSANAAQVATLGLAPFGDHCLSLVR